MNSNSNKIKNIQKIKMSIDRTVNVHVSYVQILISYVQMYSTRVRNVLFRWDMAWGKLLFSSTVSTFAVDPVT